MKKLETLVFEALGEASMCWSETPKGVFQDSKAKDIGDKLIDTIQALTSVKSESEMSYENQKAIQDNLVESYPFKKSESAEEVLSKYPSTKLGLDDFYGKKTTIQAMHDFANNSEAKWISVEDRLPENDNEVLIICSGEVVQAYLKNGIWKGSVQVTYNMNDGYVHDRNICKQGKSNPFDNVTHWMPLPTPPNQ
jgi:flagellar basal body L-ring protein FlgH